MPFEILPAIAGTAFVLCTTFTIPIIVLASLIFPWLNGLSSADSDAVNKVLGNNFKASIAFGLGGSAGWILGLGIVWKFNAVGAILMVFSTFWWFGSAVSAQWKAEKLLSPYFETIPGARKGCHEINAMLSLVLSNVCIVGMLVICLIIACVKECIGNNRRARRTHSFYPPRPPIPTTQTTAAAASVAQSSIPVEVPATDVEMGLTKNMASPAHLISSEAAQRSVTRPNPELQDGAG